RDRLRRRRLRDRRPAGAAGRARLGRPHRRLPVPRAGDPRDRRHAHHPTRRLRTMQITRSGIDTQKGPADWFTGDVYIDAVAAPAGTSTFAAAAVHFTPGARTAWHTHPHGQTIFVTEGVGRCQREDAPAEDISPA